MISIKLFFPGNVYSSRSVKVKSESKTYFLDKSNEKEPLVIEDSLHKIDFKIDYHKSNISVEKDSDRFLLVYFDLHKNGIIAMIQLMFSNRLNVIEVNKAKFNESTMESVYQKNNPNISTLSRKTGLVYFSSLLFYLFLFLFSLPEFNFNGEFNSVIFYFSLISFFGTVFLLKKGLKINAQKLRFRITFGAIATSIILFLFYPYLQFENLTMIGIAMVLILITHFSLNKKVIG